MLDLSIDGRFVEGRQYNIPKELMDRPQWVVWRNDLRERDGKRTKVPYQTTLIDSPDKARSNDRSTWGPFNAAIASYRINGTRDVDDQLDGIGYEFNDDDPYFGVDFDKCINPDGTIQDWAREWMDRLGPTYAEISPSGTGIKCIYRGSVPIDGTGHKRGGYGPDGKGAMEIYHRGRYFTITGNVPEGMPKEIGESDPQAVADLVAELTHRDRKADPGPNGKAPCKAATASPVAILDDAELLDKARRASNGAEFSALYDHGDCSRFPSDSEADFSLCGRLAFWTNSDAARIERLFNASALGQREKWRDRPDYRETTIRNAIEANGSNGYNPQPRNGTSATAPSPAPVAGEIKADPDVNKAPNDPLRLVMLYRERYEHSDGTRLRYWKGDWWEWNDGSYHPVPENELRADIVPMLADEFDRLNIEDIQKWEANGRCNLETGRPTVKPVRCKISEKLKTDIVGILTGYHKLASREFPDAPAWIKKDQPWPASEVLPTRKSLVHLPSLIAGKPCKIQATPNYFGQWALDYDFDPDAPEPAEWIKFLDSLWGDDPDSITTLQEWFGYILTNDTRQQKILVLIGPKRGGKGTIARILREMIGKANVASPTLTGIATDFGLAPLIGKPLGIFDDARVSSRTDQAAVVSHLLSISGEGSLTVNRKHKPQWDGLLPTRLMMLSNELPKLSDASGALAGRMLILRLVTSFYGREDLGLFDRLKTEMPGILNWAICGWERLTERGRFIQPETGESLVQKMEDLASPVGRFVRECCDIGPDYSVGVGELFDAWRLHCLEQNRDHVGTHQTFGKDLDAVVPGLNTVQRQVKGVKDRSFTGIRIKVED